jgi:hypothetical protein
MTTCKHCHQEITKSPQGGWDSTAPVIPQYCWVDPEHGSQLHEPATESTAKQCLPDPGDLLPGSSKFTDHPGYEASACELREVVVAQTYATNNGFRCAATGGHCVPGNVCSTRRATQAERDRLHAQLVQTLPPGA